MLEERETSGVRGEEPPPALQWCCSGGGGEHWASGKWCSVRSPDQLLGLGVAAAAADDPGVVFLQGHFQALRQASLSS